MSGTTLTTGRLVDLAHAKSGDKLDRANVGLVCRSDAAYRIVAHQVTEVRVEAYLAAFLGEVGVERYLLPKIRGINLVISRALDGGSTSSRRVDRLAKAVSGIVLSMPMDLGVARATTHREADPA